MVTTCELLGTLRSLFGHESFRPHQYEIMSAIMERRDVCAVLPTGGGKSLCYQMPARLINGLAVVISPLISLMKDQVDAASAHGIAAAYINSTMTPGAVHRTMEMIREGSVELLYSAPERFVMPSFLSLLSSIPLAFFAIDEAHCIAEWGHDFRPLYLELSLITDRFPGVPVTAFTATATPRVEREIIERLRLRDPLVVRASCNRPNLFYEVKKKHNLSAQIIAFINDHRAESGIVYRTTRKEVMDTAQLLRSQGLGALPYHAGLSPQERSANQEAFMSGSSPVIVGTIAFGMGIDKPDVRYVIHGDLPRSIEAYFQETGRAGRDGAPAHCLLLHGPSDMAKLSHFTDRIADEGERGRAKERLRHMINFASSCTCRRRALLAYFGESAPKERCSMCDACCRRERGAGGAALKEPRRQKEVTWQKSARTSFKEFLKERLKRVKEALTRKETE